MRVLLFVSRILLLLLLLHLLLLLLLLLFAVRCQCQTTATDPDHHHHHHHLTHALTTHAKVYNNVFDLCSVCVLQARSSTHTPALIPRVKVHPRVSDVCPPIPVLQARNLRAETVDAVLERRKTTSFKLQLAAPRLVLPRDLSDPETAVLIVDMGAIHLLSVVQPPPFGENIAIDPSTDTEPDVAGEPNTDEPSRLYDRVALHVTAIQVLIVPSVAAWRELEALADRSWFLVYQLSLELELLHCILPRGTHEYTDVIVLGSLSEANADSLHLRLSLEQLHTIAAVLATLEERGPANHVVVGLEDAQHAPPREGPEKLPGSLRARAHFAVRDVSLLLSGLEGRELVELRASGIELKAHSQPSDRTVSFGLGSLRVEDRMWDTGTRCSRLIDSTVTSVRLRGETPKEARLDGGPLVYIQYLASAADVPDELHVRFNHVHVEWNPRTVTALLAFARLPAGDATSAIRRTARPGATAAEPLAADSGSRQGKRSASGLGGGLRVLAQLEALSVSLNLEESGRQLALLAMRELVTEVCFQADGAISVSGQLGNLTAKDTYTSDQAPYEMLGLREDEESLLTFAYERPAEDSRAQARASTLCDSSLRIRMSSVRVSYWHPAIMRTVNYLQEGVLGALVSATASTVAHVARSVLSDGVEEASSISLDIEVGSPLFLLPVAAASPDGIRVDLGCVVIRNVLERGGDVEPDALLDRISVSVSQMQLCALLPDFRDASSDRETSIIEDVGLEVSIERGVGLSFNRALSVAAAGTKLVCTCSKMQYLFLMEVFSLNLAGGAEVADHEPLDTSLEKLDNAEAAAAPCDSSMVRWRLLLTMGHVELSLHDADGPLVLASLDQLGVGMTRSSGGYAEYNLGCDALVLQDTRVSIAARPLADLVWSDRDRTPLKASSKQLNVVYAVEPGPSRTLVVSLYGTRVNVVPEAFAAAASFFTSPSTHGLSSPLGGEISRIENLGQLASLQQTLNGHRKTIVLLSLEETELFLPRDPRRSDTDGFAVRGAVCIKIRFAEYETRLEVKALQLQLLVRRLESTRGTTILSPTDISVTGVHANGDVARTQFKLIASQPIDLFLSFSDIFLASDIVSSLSGTTGSPGTTIMEPAGEQPSLYFTGHFSVAADVESVRFVAINDWGGRAIPLASVAMKSMTAVCSGTNDHLVFLCCAHTEILVHNPKVLGWEPLLEPWCFRFHGDVHPLAEPPLYELQMEADDVCNVNFSVPLCKLVASTVVTLTEASSGLAQSSPDEQPFLAFEIMNDSGLVLFYGRDAPETKLLPGESHAFNLWPDVDRSSLCSVLGPPSFLLKIALDLWPCVLEVPIGRTRKRMLELEARSDSGTPLYKMLACEVTLSADRKQLRLLSTTILHNATEVLLAVRVWHANQETESVHPLAPGSMLPLPIRPDQCEYRITLRPMDGNYVWSAKYLIPGDTGPAAVPTATTLPLECEAVPPDGTAWHFLVHRSGRRRGECQIRIHAPLVLRNLLALPLQFELRGQGGFDAGLLGSGEVRCVHAFAPLVAVSLRAAVEGYAPSDRVLVAAPAGTAAGVLCEELQLFDGQRNPLPLQVLYERLQHGCVHSLSLIAPCWVLNRTGLPISLRGSGARHGFCGDEPAVVVETVSENQRRSTIFNNFTADGLYSTDSHGPFSDEGMSMCTIPARICLDSRSSFVALECVCCCCLWWLLYGSVYSQISSWPCSSCLIITHCFLSTYAAHRCTGLESVWLRVNPLDSAWQRLADGHGGSPIVSCPRMQLVGTPASRVSGCPLVWSGSTQRGSALRTGTAE